MLLEPSMKQEQKLSLSYRQTLSLQVLAMNTSELNDYIEEQQLENPMRNWPPSGSIFRAPLSMRSRIPSKMRRNISRSFPTAMWSL